MKVFGVSTKQRKLIIYEHIDNDMCKYFDGKTYHETTKQTIHDWSFTKSYSPKYIPIKKDENKTFEESFFEFVEKANMFRKLSLDSNGKNALINLYKSGLVTNTVSIIL
jgi:hypothetical protein